uniref:Uncharacterized protein n=1 Tax=Arundo donax TaxID=35708 RepID=A0A0A8ZZQ8_ARUDO
MCPENPDTAALFSLRISRKTSFLEWNISSASLNSLEFLCASSVERRLASKNFCLTNSRSISLLLSCGFSLPDCKASCMAMFSISVTSKTSFSDGTSSGLMLHG